MPDAQSSAGVVGWLFTAKIDGAAAILGASFSLNILVASLSFARAGVCEAIRRELERATTDEQMTADINKVIDSCETVPDVLEPLKRFTGAVEDYSKGLARMFSVLEPIFRTLMVACAAYTIYLLAVENMTRAGILLMLPYPIFAASCYGRKWYVLHRIRSLKKKLMKAVSEKCRKGGDVSISDCLERMRSVREKLSANAPR